MAYRDLRAYLDELSRRGLLHTIDEKVCKDTELVPLVRLQFRGLADGERKAFWFRSVADAAPCHSLGESPPNGTRLAGCNLHWRPSRASACGGKQGAIRGRRIWLGGRVEWRSHRGGEGGNLRRPGASAS